MTPRLRTWMPPGWLVLAGSVAWAQPAPIAGTYMCTDAHGKTLTSDRPIPACADREQKVFGPSGTVIRRIGPTLTSQETAAQQERQKANAQAQQRVLDEKRRDRALLMRYPNQAAHDRERGEVLARVVASKEAADKRIEDLLAELRKMNQELEFYRKDPSKAPAALRAQLDAITGGLVEQKRYIATQDAEAQRINGQFDTELARLRPLWALQTAGQPGAATSR